jgi:uncharacterized protein (TIGR03435 family)
MVSVYSVERQRRALEHPEKGGIVMNRVVCILISMAVIASAQDKPAPSRSPLAFEVVSVRPTPPDRRDQFESYCSNGGRFISRGTPLLWSIKWAYGLNDYQMSPGWPDWLNSFGTYNIEAETEGRVTDDQCRMMVQALFEDRFKLAMHRQTKTVSAYALVTGKKGSKLATRGRVTINGAVKQATSEREPPEGWTMARLANYLASVKGVGQPVLDKTGLTGIYGLTLNYATADGDDRPDIFSAVQEQLGLKLQSIKAPTEMFVIDHVERPSVN